MQRSRPFFDADLETSKQKLFSLISYEIHADPALDFHTDTNPYQIVVAPTRTSKSYSASPEATHDFFPRVLCDEDGTPLVDDNGQLVAERYETIVWIVGTDYDTIKEWDYCWTHIHDLGIYAPFGRLTKASNNSQQGNMLMRVEWGSTVGKKWVPIRDKDGRPAYSILQGKSAKNQKSLQSEEIKTCIMSEAADHDRDTFERHLENRCGRVIFPTTPKRSAIWLYELIEKGRTDPSLGISHFKYTRECNPKYDYVRYERAKRRATATYGDYRNDPGFMEQFEAEWTFEGGKVLPFRWIAEDGKPPTNVVTKIEPWVSTATWYVSLDYGYNDPAVALFVACGHNGKKLIASEIYESGLEPHVFVDRIRQRVSELRLNVKWYVPDPQQPLVTPILRRHGLPLFDQYPVPYMRDRAAGFQQLRDALSVDPDTGEPELYVHASCAHTIAEWKTIRFKDGAANEWSDSSIVGADHAADAARYLMRSEPKHDDKGRDWLREFMAGVSADEEMRRRRMTTPGRIAGHSPMLAGAY